MRSKCFVISPIGEVDSDIRKKADQVFENIIDPAIQECDLSAYRSDHLNEPGRISDQMFSAIINADFCIAILSGYNPNVFYELAVAQCIGKPAIILMAKGNDLPFDIHDFRCIRYDHEVTPPSKGVYKNELIKQIKKLQENKYQAEPLLTRYGYSSEFKILNEYPSSHWTDLGKAQEVWLLGVSLFSLLKRKSLLRNKLKENHSIRVLLSTPEESVVKCAALRSGVYENISKQVSYKIGEIKKSISTLLELRKEFSSQLEIKSSDYLPSYGNRIVNPNDKSGKMYIKFYPYKIEPKPKVVIQASSLEWYKTFKQEFEEIWNDAVNVK